jgi:uncharacterized protein VirK/YbjX
VDSSNIRPLDHHVKAVVDFTIPSNVKQLQRFLNSSTFIITFFPASPAFSDHSLTHFLATRRTLFLPW